MMPYLITMEAES